MNTEGNAGPLNGEAPQVLIVDDEQDFVLSLEELIKTDPDAKVMIASGYSGEEPKVEALKTGARGIISKPYAIKKMLRAIREVIDAV